MKTPVFRKMMMTTVGICLVSLAFTSALHAQYKEGRYRKSNFYLGIEGNMGTKTFSVKSDISAIDGMNVLEEGFSFGAVMGGKMLLAKIRHGFFKPSSSHGGEKINLRNLEFNLNAFPLEVFGTKNSFFRPYLILGIDRSQLKFLGNYRLPTPLPPPLPATPANTCPCVCPGDEEIIPVPQTTPAPPASSKSEETPNDTVLGNVNIVHGSAGTGLIIHVPGKNRFLNFFMEAQYGIPLSTRSTSPAFDRTSISDQLSLSAGIAVGIRR